MYSYWGIDHGAVSKSYIPGKGWVSAAKAGKNTLNAAAKAGKKSNRYTGMRGVAQSDEFLRHSMSDLKAMERGVRTKRVHDLGRGRKVNIRESRDMPPGMEAFAYMRGKNRNIVVKPGADPKFVKHEFSHVTPKNRKSHRMAQINRDPKKAMREEARADMAGGMNWRKAPGPVKSQVDAVRGKQYSGYAASAGSPLQGDMQRRAGRNADAMTKIQARLEKVDEKRISMLPKREKMFTQPSLSEYRKVQDKISTAQGKKPLLGEKVTTGLRAARDYGTVPAALGAGGYAAHRHTEKQKNRLRQQFTKSFAGGPPPKPPALKPISFTAHQRKGPATRINRPLRNKKPLTTNKFATTPVAKSDMEVSYRAIPLTDKERRDKRIKNALGSAVVGGGLSAGITGVMNRKVPGFMRPARSAGLIGAGLGAGVGALEHVPRNRIVQERPGSRK